MSRLFTLSVAALSLALASCAAPAGAKKECTSCCDSKAKPECCQKAAAAKKECAECKTKKH